MANPGNGGEAPIPVPGGSYHETAENVSVDAAGTLHATLKTEGGDLQAAAINLRAPRFANVDGVLVYEESFSQVASRLANSAPATASAPSQGGGSTASTVSDVSKAAAAIGGAIAGHEDGGPGEYNEGNATIGSGDDISTMEP